MNVFLNQHKCIESVLFLRLNGHLTTTEVSITGLPIDWIPLDLKLNLPAYGLVRTPLLITYHLHNRSTQLIQLDVSMEASDAFMFAGYKQARNTNNGKKKSMEKINGKNHQKI